VITMTDEAVRKYNGLLKIVEAVPYQCSDPKDRGLTLYQQAKAREIDREKGPVQAEKYRVECRRRSRGC
jgi:hypothetical protein